MKDIEVTLYDYGPNKLQVVKIVKEYLKVGIAEAKAICDATEQAPQTFKFDYIGSEAKDFTAALLQWGATVEIDLQDSNNHNGSTVRENIDLIKELERRIEILETRIDKLSNENKSSDQKILDQTQSLSRENEARIAELEARIRQMENFKGSTTSHSGGVATDKLVVDKFYNISLRTRNYTDDGLLIFDKYALFVMYNYHKNRHPDKLKEELFDDISTIKRGFEGRHILWIDSLGGNSEKLSPFIDMRRYSIILLSDGKIFSYNRIGDDLNALKAVSTTLGHDVPKGTRKDKLAAELVAKYGDGKTAVVGDKVVTSDGYVYKLSSEINIQNLLHGLKEAQEEIEKYYKVSIPLNDDSTKSPKENMEAIKDYISGLTRKVKPQSDAAQAEEFERVAKEVYKELGISFD